MARVDAAVARRPSPRGAGRTPGCRRQSSQCRRCRRRRRGTIWMKRSTGVTPRSRRDGIERAELVSGCAACRTISTWLAPPTSSSAFCDARRIVVALVRNEDGDRRSSHALYRVGVGRDVDARRRASPRSAAIASAELPPHAGGSKLDVRDLNGNTRALADRDRFLERVERLVRFVADVRHVDAAVVARPFSRARRARSSRRSRRLGPRDRSTTRRRRRASLPRRDAPSAHLVRPRRALVVVGHHEPPHGGVADHHRPVSAAGIRRGVREVLEDRPGDEPSGPARRW